MLTWIPVIVFGASLLALFGFFGAGFIFYFFSEDKERGKEIIIRSVFFFLVLIFVFLAFAGVTYLIKRGEIFKPSPTGEFPASPMGKFPEPPKYFVLEGYSFSGPFDFKEVKKSKEPFIYAVLCRNGQEHKVLELINPDGRTALSEYYSQCWRENCPSGEIRLAVYWLAKDSNESLILKEMSQNISQICKKE